ncbi:2-succinylbenzoate--CoA ligase [Mycobacteroides abscessus subsp. abscessus]|uniref:AMP-binding protein n=1 Tax=Mycobacteroides abscessus TaxID=36809 RepID=UPI00092A6C80|nr:AMP-binding protein [Mycobacteroides abscessus]SHT48931.1 2-succinylbenzoate--CoA ligase [Mycobacteroides abscessus subsp. abscessus]SHW34916.1 2-succinylbenzoate--CoA ligase [Mycobacteroides abscessus subsp. abscessus]SIF89435.1 2-succinylbenzoate--CoA ligase [Mycobacteroides abscessus subsp. abscessus]SKD17689.1 2-succinylbenzoate--CoA ligase [Mycobacteroides abscessus subsp. abscessus]SKM24423.1 2-succinylbenzoate--CoA ligase [Mycobacteroides abscessus subsp. abscessus]
MFFDLSVRDFLDRAELVYPERVGVVDEPVQPAPSWGQLTYRQLAARARGQAAALDALGVGPGERVAIVSQNSARLLTSFFGVSGWGRILVPINFRLAPAEIEYIVGHSGASVLVVDPEVRGLLDTVRATHNFVLGEDDAAVFGELDSPHAVTPDPWSGSETGTATLNYTSGTTSRPKGVQLTHRNIWINAVVFGLHATLRDDDVLLHTLPMFHCNGWGWPYAATGMGARHIVLRKVDGDEILRRVEQHGVTVMCAAPTVVDSILDAAARWQGPIPGRDRVRIIVAGAPPPTRTIARVRTELGWEFIQIYGLTETAPLITMNRFRSEWAGLDVREQARMLGRAGAPAIGVRVSVAEDGEVLTQSNTNLDGYWDQPQATAEALAGNWFHTGDRGSVDDGYLTISDRKKDIIITGGENVTSIEVEDALISHPGVREAAVVGVPDEKWGELVTAVVVVVTLDDPPSGADLIAHCRDRLAGYKCPKRVEFVDSLPRTATGKVQKFRLREQLARD